MLLLMTTMLLLWWFDVFHLTRMNFFCPDKIIIQVEFSVKINSFTGVKTIFARSNILENEENKICLKMVFFTLQN